jgi:hypothetical protein
LALDLSALQSFDPLADLLEMDHFKTGRQLAGADVLKYRRRVRLVTAVESSSDTCFVTREPVLIVASVRPRPVCTIRLARMTSPVSRRLSSMSAPSISSKRPRGLVM